MVDNSVINTIMNSMNAGISQHRANEYLKLSVQQQHQHALAQERMAKHEEMAGQVRDFEMLNRMQQYGRPVQDGMVDAEFDVTPELAATVPGLPSGMKIKAPRKANNPYTYTDSTGKKHQTELLSPHELMMREADLGAEGEARKGKARTDAKVSEHQTMLDRFGIDVPLPGQKGKMTRILPDQADNIGSLQRAIGAGDKPPSASAQGWRAFTDYGTGNVSFARINPETGTPEVKTAEELHGLAAPRPRQGPTAKSSKTTAAKPPTSGQITGLAEQVLAESKAGGGTSIEHAITNLEDRKNYTGTPIGDNRYQIIAALKKQIPKGKNGAGANRWKMPLAEAKAEAAAPAATPKPPQAAKAISISQVQAYATKFGISVSQAKKKAESEGYKVQ